MPDVTVAAGNVAAHKLTLTAGVVTNVKFTDNIYGVEIITDGTADIYYTVDGTNPTVQGGNCFPLPAGSLSDIRSVGPMDTVRIISAGTPVVTVVRAE